MDDGRTIAAATRKAGVMWVRPDGATRDTAVWHLWHAGHVYLVLGGAEQPGTGLAGAPAAQRARVVVRSRGQLVQWQASIEWVEAESDEWQQVVPLLHAKRLNAPDGDAQPARWARESTVLRLTPTGEVPPIDQEEQVVTTDR